MYRALATILILYLTCPGTSIAQPPGSRQDEWNRYVNKGMGGEPRQQEKRTARDYYTDPVLLTLGALIILSPVPYAIVVIVSKSREQTMSLLRPIINKKLREGGKYEFVQANDWDHISYSVYRQVRRAQKLGLDFEVIYSPGQYDEIRVEHDWNPGGSSVTYRTEIKAYPSLKVLIKKKSDGGRTR